MDELLMATSRPPEMQHHHRLHHAHRGLTLLALGLGLIVFGITRNPAVQTALNLDWSMSYTLTGIFAVLVGLILYYVYK